jgi:hypothetical protein
VGLFDSAAQWQALGHSLGLAPFQPTAGYSHGVSFRQLKRSLGFPASHLAPSFNHWHYGKSNGVEVLLLIYTQGSGSSQTTHTGVIARVDPPLFLGLGIDAKPLLELFGPKRVPTGYPLIDQHLRISGFDLNRVLTLLAPDQPIGHELLTRVVGGHEVDPGKIRWQLETALYMATTLAHRRELLPATPQEIAQQAEWQRFADSSGFKFDPARMTMFGKHQGTDIKIALETAGQEIRTSVNVRFPRAVHVAFTARRTQMPAFLQGLFGQDIKVGDPVFDDLFQVTGHPEHVIREALSRPALIQVLKYLGALTTEVQLNHEQLFFRVVGPTSSGDLLASICETGRITSAAFFGEVEALGPYR